MDGPRWAYFQHPIGSVETECFRNPATVLARAVSVCQSLVTLSHNGGHSRVTIIIPLARLVVCPLFYADYMYASR